MSRRQPVHPKKNNHPPGKGSRPERDARTKKPRKQQPILPENRRRAGQPSTLYPLKLALANQEAAEARRRQEERKRRQRQALMRKRRRRFRIISSCLILLLILGLVLFFQKRLKKDPIQELPTLGEEAMDTLFSQAVVSDNKGRPLSRAEKEADFQQFKSLLLSLPQASLKKSRLTEEGLDAMMENAVNGSQDIAFYQALDAIMKSLGNPQDKMINIDDYQSWINQLGSSLYAEDSPYGKTLNDPRVAERYGRARRIEKKAIPSQPSKLELVFSPDKKTAIFRGFSFREDRIQEDRKFLEEKWKETQGAETILLDLREAGGTAESYWQQVLIPFCSASNLTASTKLYFPQGFDEYVNYFSFQERGGFFDLEDGLTLLTDLPKDSLPEEVRDLSFQKKMTYEVRAMAENSQEKPIHILVDRKTGQAAETFASFMHFSGAAETFGQPTAGGGWQLPPFLIKLEHSAYLLQLDACLPLTPDGKGLEREIGFVPTHNLQGDNLLQAYYDFQGQAKD